MENQNVIDDKVLVIRKFVRKTNICGGDVSDVVDSKNELTQYYLEIFADNELIYVRENQSIYKVCSKEVEVYKKDLPKLKEQENREREQLREKNRKKKSKEMEAR